MCRCPAQVVLQINSDEEVGSALLARLDREPAQESAAVLVLEPGTGLEGKLKTARKGVGDYTWRCGARRRMPEWISRPGRARL
ncbi:MAG: hypothetical protein QM757_24480 [Paludibaculum sp.]